MIIGDVRIISSLDDDTKTIQYFCKRNRALKGAVEIFDSNDDDGTGRHFTPIAATTLDDTTMTSILDFASVPSDAPASFYAWAPEVHRFRIVAGTGGEGPTPEGTRRDGVDDVSVVPISRVGAPGGGASIGDRDVHRPDRSMSASPFREAMAP